MPDYTTFQDKLSDLEFVRTKALSGNWITVQGAINTLASEIAYIPASGKTFFLHSAKIIINTHSNANVRTTVGTSNTNNTVKAALKVDSVIKDTTMIGSATGSFYLTGSSGGGGSGYGLHGDGRFNCIGLNLVGNGVKKVTIENILDNGSVDAFMAGWIEDT